MGLGYSYSIYEGNILMRLDAFITYQGIDALEKRISGITRELDLVVKKTAIQIHSEVIREITASKKRHGTNELAKSYYPKKIGETVWAVTSKLSRAVVFEVGRVGGRIIKPKTAKMLTIPLRDDVLTESGSQISQPAKNRLFELLKNRKNRTLKNIYDEAGIVLAKQAKMSSLKGKFLMRDKIRPKAVDMLNANYKAMILKLLGGL